jgi:hypothetical protein
MVGQFRTLPEAGQKLMTSTKASHILPIHPVLFTIYPVLSLLATNLDQVPAQTALRSGFISLAGGCLLYLILRLFLRDNGKAAPLATFWLALFFSYGHIYQLVEGKALGGLTYGKHRYLATVWGLLFLAGSWWLLKRLKSLRELNLALNVIGVALILFPAWQIGSFAVRLQQMKPASQAVPKTVRAGSSGESSPDIYYIILDGYSRADVMEKLYNLDIAPFMNELKSMGFVFPKCAQSNYGITAFSMFASLNMEYLDAYGTAFPIGSDRSIVDYQAIHPYLVNSEVRKIFEEKGYQFITFETGFWWLNIDDSDQYIVENNNPLKKYSKAYDLSNFEDLFIRTTALRILTEANTAFLTPLTRRVKTPAQQHYEWVEFALDQLGQIPQIPGRKFIYFHVLAPHDPFVFAADGSFRAATDPNSDIPAYPDEVTYLNRRVVEIARNLIAGSETPPIIIIQGDHGWDPRYRMQILNAYYLPQEGSQKLYPTITPVNTFRLILDTYFGEQLGLLPDKSFYSMGADFPQYGVRSTPYQLTPVPITCMDDTQ